MRDADIDERQQGPDGIRFTNHSNCLLDKVGKQAGISDVREVHQENFLVGIVDVLYFSH